MEQKLLMRVIENVYMLNGMNGKNRAVLKLNSKVIYIAIYQNFFDDLDLSETIQIHFENLRTNQQLNEAYNKLLYYQSKNSK